MMLVSVTVSISADTTTHHANISLTTPGSTTMFLLLFCKT